MSITTPTGPSHDDPQGPLPPALHTLVIDVGGTGLKANVLGPSGQPEQERVRVKTTYPLPPDTLVADLVGLVAPLPPAQRVSVGFPGVVRDGHVVTAPAFATKGGPGTEVDRDLEKAWSGFDLAGALSSKLGLPVRVGNDADVQGAGVVTGHGLELILTLGTGLGSSVFRNGRLALHLELAHTPSSTGVDYNEYLGDAARKKLGTKRWNRRVRKALAAFDALIRPDAILIGGGNASKVDLGGILANDAAVGAKVRLVGNDGGLLGGIKLWEGDDFD
jgi:polyphosphate glucokinase